RISPSERLTIRFFGLRPAHEQNCSAQVYTSCWHTPNFSPTTVGKRRCRGALQNCGDSAWYSADRASVVECGARAPLCLGAAKSPALRSCWLNPLYPSFGTRSCARCPHSAFRSVVPLSA